MSIEMSECNKCELHKTAQFVKLMGQGPNPCNMMIVGEAPTWRKDRDVPFQGEAGKILEEALSICGVKHSEVYHTNVVKCRPPENRSPKAYEIAVCQGYLTEEISQVQPSFVLLLGTSAARYLGRGRVTVAETRGKWFRMGETRYLVTMHPGAVVRDKTKFPLFVNDIRKFVDRARGVKSADTNTLNVTIANDADGLEKFWEVLDASPRLAFDIETTTLFPWEAGARVLSIGFGFEDSQFIIPVGHTESLWGKNQEWLDCIVERLNKALEGKTIIAHNGKFDSLWVKVKLGLNVPIHHDTLILSHLIDENTPHGLKYLAEVHCGARNYNLSLDEKTGGAKLEKLAEYNAWDVFYTRKLYNKFLPRLKEDPQLYTFYKKVMMPAVNAFIDIEYRGVYVDKDKLLETKKYLQDEVARLSAELEVFKPGINWNSTKQVAEYLFKDLGLPILDTTPKGAPSTSESVMLRLKDKHPCISIILEYKEKAKMLGTFITSWEGRLVNSRLHPSFKLHGTVTGRLSCEEPNLQQVPRDPKLRSLICAPPGSTFVEADFSQVELRIAAMLSGDPRMRELFVTGVDIHTNTAEMVSGKKLTEVDPKEAKEWRKKAKAVNFGFLYGMGAKKFQEYARDKYGVAFSQDESRHIRQKFFASYSGLQPWYERQERVAKMNGYVRSPCGRVRHLPGIYSPDEYDQSQAVRQSINSPVQGLASDMTLMSVVDITRLLPQVRIVGTVHDAILMEIPDDQAEECIPKVKAIMECPPTLTQLGVRLTVPIISEVSVGNWGAGKAWSVKQ